MFSGNRPATMQQIPCKTINDITYPPERVALTPVMSGYKSVIFGRGDLVTTKNSVFYSPQFPLNNPVLKPTKTFLA